MAYSVPKFEECGRRAESVPDAGAESGAAVRAGEKRRGERVGSGKEVAAMVCGMGARAVATGTAKGEGAAPAAEVNRPWPAASEETNPGRAVAGYGARGAKRFARRGFSGQRQGFVRRAGTRGRGGPSVGPNYVPNFWSRPKREIVMACLSSDIGRCWWGKCWKVLGFPADGGPDLSGSLPNARVMVGDGAPTLPFGWMARLAAVGTQQRFCARARRAGG